MITADFDFLALAKEWSAHQREHPGIFFIQPDIRQAGENGIGLLIRALNFYAEAVDVGAADVDKDMYNQITFVRFKEWL